MKTYTVVLLTDALIPAPDIYIEREKGTISRKVACELKK